MSANPDNAATLPPLESVLCTEELNRRPPRPPNYEKENRALVSLAQSLADSPRTILQALADTILEVFECDSAGVSLVTEDGKRFHWPAIAGEWKPHIGGGTPRDFGPCGDVLDRNTPLMFRHFERRYTYFLPVTPPVEECLLVPFYVKGKAVGTIWAITHADASGGGMGPGARKFDAEDLRMLVSLGTFASTAYQAVEQLHVLGEQAHERGEAAQALREMNEALLVSSVRQHELADQARKAEAALRDSEIRYRRLFQNARDGILILDAATGKVIDANAFMCGLLGVELSEILGKELWEIGLFGDAATNTTAFEELQRNGYIRYDHLRLRQSNGEATQVEFVSNVYREGDRLVAQCNVRDITARAEMEEQIKRQAEALSEQSRRKDEFLAMLSHELRNPLAPIRSATHLLRLQERGSENLIQQQAREVIERQVATLTRLVSDLLEVSRALTGRVRLSLQTVDMNEVLRHAIEAARPLFEQRRHTLSVDLCSQPVWVGADPTRMEEVLVNLLTNAGKYTDNGGRIEVVCEQQPNRAMVRVRDNGAGIDPALLPHIFDLFTQGERTLDRAQGGLGIGLSLAHRLVEMHGGGIEAHSDGPGKGSEFIVRMPLAPAPGIVPPAPADEPPHPQGLRVLVVDDNVDACTMLANLVRLRGHGVQIAHTGPGALAAARAWRPDVVLLDIGLPEIDGFEIARRLRAEAPTRSVRLIAVTGYGTERDVQLGREAGFDAHLLKPVELAEVERLLATWREQRTLPGGSRAS